MTTRLHQDTMQERHTEHPINPLFIQRWSPRSYAEKEVPNEELLRLFEAAKWAPSAGNGQPWRYIIATTNEDRKNMLTFINESNRVWCAKAPVLTVVLSKKINDRGAPSRSHAFDAGASWAYLALEAANQGLIAHAMGGFDHDLARTTLQIPEEYDLHAVIAIGYQGAKDALPPALQERELPSQRRQLADTIYSGFFGNKSN